MPGTAYARARGSGRRHRGRVRGRLEHRRSSGRSRRSSRTPTASASTTSGSSSPCSSSCTWSCRSPAGAPPTGGVRGASALTGLALIAAGNAISLIAAEPALAFAGRAVVGIGTGFAFVGGSDYIRARGGSPLLQGVYGGASVLAPGIAVAVVPLLETRVGLARRISQRDRRGRRLPRCCSSLRPPAAANRPARGRAARHAASSATAGSTGSPRSTRCRSASASIVGNWVVTLLEHHGHSKSSAALVGSLTLVLGFFTRVAGGALLRRPDASRWVAAEPRRRGPRRDRARAARADAGARRRAPRSSGSPPAYRSRWRSRAPQQARPDAPGAAVGFVNAWAALAHRRRHAARRAHVLAAGRRPDRLRRARRPRGTRRSRHAAVGSLSSPTKEARCSASASPCCPIRRTRAGSS